VPRAEPRIPATTAATWVDRAPAMGLGLDHSAQEGLGAEPRLHVADGRLDGESCWPWRLAAAYGAASQGSRGQNAF